MKGLIAGFTTPLKGGAGDLIPRLHNFNFIYELLLSSFAHGALPSQSLLVAVTDD